MNIRIRLALAVAVAGALAVGGAAALAGGGGKQVRGFMTGYQEVPAVSTSASGAFEARISQTGDEIAYRLSYSALEGAITQAHIHVGQRAVNGGISAWLCSNLASPPTPAGTQACPAGPATVEGTITAADIVGPTAQGVDAGEFDELVRAIQAGVAYANVHSSRFGGGEIRGQLRGGWGRGGRGR